MLQNNHRQTNIVKNSGIGHQITLEKKMGALFWIFIAYFFFEYVRPQDQLLTFLSPLRIPAILTVAMLIGFLKSDKQGADDILIKLTITFLLLVSVTVVFANNTFHVYSIAKGLLLTIVGGVLPAAIVINDVRRLQKLFILWIMIHIIVVGESLFHGGHGAGGFLWDENDLALAINMVLPFVFYFMINEKIFIKKVMLISIFIMFVAGVVNTASRGGFLGMVAVFGMIFLLSHNKMKNMFKILIIGLIFSGLVLSLIPESYITEIQSITDSGDSTRSERIYLWGLGWEMFKDNPILGVGAGNYPWNVYEYQLKDPEFDPDTMLAHGGRPSHSLYLTLIPELGIIGITLFLLIVTKMLKRLYNIFNQRVDLAKINSELSTIVIIAKSCFVSLVSYLVTGTFLSVLYYPPFWYLIGFVIVLDRLYKKT